MRKCDTQVAAFVLMAIGHDVATLDVDVLPMADRPETMTRHIMDFFLKGVEA